MIWLIILMSINGGPPRVVERIPFDDMQSCQAEKAVRDSREGTFTLANKLSVKSDVVCLDAPSLTPPPRN
jgi:hypothetical protein